MPVNITINKEIFNEAYRSKLTETSRYQIIFGGSSSGKSFAIFNMVPLWALQGHSILILRKNQASNSKSVWLEVCKAIGRMHLEKYFTINKSSKTITSKVSKGCIMLNGAYPDTERLKSITPVHGDAFSKIILEEATEFTEDDFNQISLRQRGNSPFKKSITLLFNPVFKKHWIYKRFFEKYESSIDFNIETSVLFEDPVEDLSILKTTYLDNRFLDPAEIATIENLVRVSSYHHEVYCKGNFGILGNRCLPNVQYRDFNLHELGFKNWGVNIGVDFGFTNDPTAVVFSTFDEVTRTLYVFDEFGGKGLSEEFIADTVREKLKLWGVGSYTAFAENEPRTVSRLNTLGFWAAGVGAKNYIIDDIFWLNQINLVIHPRCKELVEETKLYTYVKDTNGDTTNVPIDKYNHYIDGLRYSQKDHISVYKYIGCTRKF